MRSQSGNSQNLLIQTYDKDFESDHLTGYFMVP